MFIWSFPEGELSGWLIGWLASSIMYVSAHYHGHLHSDEPQPFPSTDPTINADVSATWTEPQNLLYILGWVVECRWMGLTGACIPSFRTSEASNLVKSAHLPVSTHYSSSLAEAAGRLMFCRIKQIYGDTTNHASTETHSVSRDATVFAHSEPSKHSYYFHLIHPIIFCSAIAFKGVLITVIQIKKWPSKICSPM